MTPKPQSGKLPNIPSHIKDDAHVALDELLSQLRQEGFYGTIEVDFLAGLPTRLRKTESKLLTTKSIDEIRGKE
jgi:hypothetical protein